jgi:hypothetical protein
MIQGTFMSPNDLFDIYSFSKIVLSVKRGENEVSWRAVAINNKLGKNSMPDTKNLILNTNVNCWDTIRFFTQSNEIEPGDEIKIYVWNSGRQKIAIKKIEVMEVE